MFLDILTREQQQLFLDAAMTLAHVDEHFNLDERTFIERVAREIDQPLEHSEPLVNAEVLERASRAFDNSPGVQVRAFMIELAGLVVADGDQSDAELALLHDLVRAVGAPAADVALFLDFAERAVELAEDAQDLLATSNSGSD